MSEKKKEEIVEHNSVETTTDISAPVGERSEVIESESTATTEVIVPEKIELTVTEDGESDE